MATQEQLRSAIQMACERLVEDDRDLFNRDVNERSFSHKFAMYLEEEVKEWNEAWNVDCEFNRDIDAKKTPYSKKLNLIDELPPPPGNDDEHATTIFPDVIVHRRGDPKNLLVIEMKKNTADPEAILFDKERKLPAYVDQLKYKAAVFVLLDMDNLSCSITWIKQLEAPFT